MIYNMVNENNINKMQKCVKAKKVENKVAECAVTTVFDRNCSAVL